MPIRKFQLPGDAQIMMDIIHPAFVYPDHPEWSIQADEGENMIDTLGMLRRIWPLLRVLRLGSPGLRHMMEGFIWEEDGQAVGLVNVIQMGASATWTIGNVAVLPAYRRRGIARALVAAGVDLARQHGAKTATLDVVTGNVPAVKLYENLGFTAYRGSVILERPADAPPPASEAALPEADLPPPGITLTPQNAFDWRPRYELAARITPEAVRAFELVDERRFRQPWVLRPLLRPIMALMGLQARRYGLWNEAGELVGHGGLQARIRSGGINEMWVTLDPAHGRLAGLLLARLLNEALTLAPGRRIEMQAPNWQEPVIQAALADGFRQLYAYTGMGRHL